MVTSTLVDTTPHIGMRSRPGKGRPPVASIARRAGVMLPSRAAGQGIFVGVDVCAVSPLRAIEHRGDGQYQGTAASRDAVKEALWRAGWVCARRTHTNWPPGWPGCTICDTVVRGYWTPAMNAYPLTIAALLLALFVTVGAVMAPR